jgi:hypothetical protein
MAKHQHVNSPHRSIESITNRVINSIGLHRASVSHASHRDTRSPRLTINKQSQMKYSTRDTYGMPPLPKSSIGTSPSAILDFRELSSLDFLHSRN